MQGLLTFTMAGVYTSLIQALKSRGNILATVAAIGLILQYLRSRPRNVDRLISDLSQVGSDLGDEHEFDVIIVGGGEFHSSFGSALNAH